MKKNTIFITGITGFIGFHLALKLKKDGYSVIGCDNFVETYDHKLKELREKILLENDVVIKHMSIQDIGKLAPLFKNNSISHFIHLAALAGVRRSIEIPLDYVETNVLGLTKILEFLKNFPKTHAVLASSSSVYGMSEIEYLEESQKTDYPVSVYAATKKSGELIAHAYSHLYQMKITNLRFFTVYGPYGRPDMAIFDFTKKILHNETIPVFNEGKMFRDFTYIDDIVDGITGAMKTPLMFSTYNLGNNKKETLLDMIRYIEEACEKKASLKLLPMQKGDVYSTHANIDKAKKDLDYHPKTSLQDGIKLFVKWYKEYKATQ